AAPLASLPSVPTRRSSDLAFISPRIQSDAVSLHPAFVMVVVVGGSALFGAVGALVAVPVSAMFRDVAQYLYIRAGEDSPSPDERSGEHTSELQSRETLVCW